MSSYYLLNLISCISCSYPTKIDSKPIENKNIKTVSLVFFFLASFIIIGLLSTSSPLYPINYWDDSNCFFTMGRGIIHGKIPYRDLYEQKGPVLYFIHAIAALISDTNFTGVYLIEVLFCFIYVYYGCQTAMLYTKLNSISFSIITLLMVLTYTQFGFHNGDSAEELAFPLLTVVLYYGLKSIRYNRLLSIKESLLIGIIAGIELDRKSVV